MIFKFNRLMRIIELAVLIDLICATYAASFQSGVPQSGIAAHRVPYLHSHQTFAAELVTSHH
jgi:hypothetical protein